jgi:hypothetical protein
MAEEDAALTIAVREALSAPRNGQTLTSALLEIIPAYLVTVVEVSDVEELDMDDMLEYASDAWEAAKGGATLPRLHEKVVRAWLGSPADGKESSSPPPHGLSSPPGGGDLGGPLGDEDKMLFGAAGPTGRDKKLLEADKLAQGLSGAQIIALSTALELGRVPAMGDVLGSVFYGSDPRTSELVKKNRKAGVTLLSAIVKSDKDVQRSISAHISGLVREYSERGMIAEASAINRWWAETQAACRNDKMLTEYIEEYFKKYSGRGLPTDVDILIVTRVAGGTGDGGVAANAAKEAKEAAKAARSEAQAAKSELSKLASQLSKLQAEFKKVKKDPKGDNISGAFGGKCFKCGESGHRASDCPKKDDEPADDDE